MDKIYSCIIIDDEPAAHSVLKSYINKETNLQLVKQCYNIPELTEYLKDNEADLLFLDIQMPEITGLDFLEKHPNPPKTVLTTAYSEYALESYDYDVIDYLLKPISYNHFQRAVQRFLSIYQPNKSFTPQQIKLKVDKETIEISEDEITYIQSLGNYVKVFVGAKFYLASTTTQEILSNLSPKLFVRIHKSYVVNLHKISDYSEKEVFVGDEILPIGITFKRELFARIEER